ncbi:MAG: AroM family protein [Dehalococcoidia bacterium]
MLGLVTIGQAPRPDFDAAFREHLPSTEIKLLGALDGMSVPQMDDLTGIDGVYPLHTLLSNGSTRDIDIKVLAPLVEAKARDLVDEGARAIAVCCAGDFPDIDCGVPVLRPGRLLPALAGAICRTRNIGVVSPIASQMAPAKEKWERDGFSVRTAFASPYRHDEIEVAAREMSDPELEVVILDCMGHGAEYRDEFTRLSGRPALLAQTLLAKVAAEVMGG